MLGLVGGRTSRLSRDQQPQHTVHHDDNTGGHVNNHSQSGLYSDNVLFCQLEKEGHQGRQGVIINIKLNEERVLVADWSTKIVLVLPGSHPLAISYFILIRVRVRVGETQVLLEQIRCYRRCGRRGL